LAVGQQFILFLSFSDEKIVYQSLRSISTLSALLKSEDQNVRISAGEAAGVLFETKSILESRWNTSQKEDDLIEQIRELALEAGGKGQPNKKTQRGVFREILSILEVIFGFGFLIHRGLFSCVAKHLWICVKTGPCILHPYKIEMDGIYSKHPQGANMLLPIARIGLGSYSN
jgi:hypothetical protein